LGAKHHLTAVRADEVQSHEPLVPAPTTLITILDEEESRILDPVRPFAGDDRTPNAGEIHQGSPPEKASLAFS
jgi:hypothetical protein